MISGDRPLPETFAQTAAAMGPQGDRVVPLRQHDRAVRPGTRLQQRQDNQCSPMSGSRRTAPLRGTLEARDAGGERCRWSRRSSRAKCLLMNGWRRGWGVKAGDVLEVGKNTPRIAQVFAEEPEVAGNFLGGAEGVDVQRRRGCQRTVWPGSCATYRL